jgi:hypothetical protein
VTLLETGQTLLDRGCDAQLGGRRMPTAAHWQIEDRYLGALDGGPDHPVY